MERNTWTFDTISTVAWVPYEQAMKTITDHERIFITKFSHRWLPVGTRLFREGAESDKCVLCKATEDFEHLFQCPQRNEGRIQFIQTLKTERNTLETAADTRDDIVNRIKQWMNKQTITESKQDTLGWGSFLRGYISNYWVNAQEAFHRRNDQSRRITPQSQHRYTGNYWAKNLIQFLWRQCRILWKGRNKQVHQPEKHNRDSPHERIHLQEKIQRLYASEMTIRAVDSRNFLAQPMEDVLRGHTRELRAWITTHEPAIKRAIIDAVIHNRLGCKDIRDFLNRRERAHS